MVSVEEEISTAQVKHLTKERDDWITEAGKHLRNLENLRSAVCKALGIEVPRPVAPTVDLSDFDYSTELLKEIVKEITQRSDRTKMWLIAGQRERGEVGVYPCRVDEMTQREFEIHMVASRACGALDFLIREMEDSLELGI